MKEVPTTTLPSHSDPPWRQRFHEAFVRFNPLYLMSAHFVLAGVFLLGLGLERAGRPEARVDLTFVIEAYQILVIAGAALLLRGAGLRRPAVMLAFLAALFLADPTLQTEILALWEKRVMAGAWLVWGFVKLAALAWALRLRPRGVTAAVPVLCLAGIALWPQALDLELDEAATLHLIAAWYTAGVISLAALGRTAVDTDLELDDADKSILDKCLRAVLRTWPALLTAHLVAWTAVFGVGLQWATFTPFALLVVLLGRDEKTAWVASGVAILTSFGSGSAVMLVACLAAILLFWRHRKPFAFLLQAPAVGPTAHRLSAADPLIAGTVLLGLGFASLIAGIWYSWRYRGKEASLADRTLVSPP